MNIIVQYMKNIKWHLEKVFFFSGKTHTHALIIYNFVVLNADFLVQNIPHLIKFTNSVIMRDRTSPLTVAGLFMYCTFSMLYNANNTNQNIYFTNIFGTAFCYWAAFLCNTFWVLI